jgi:transposase
MRGNESRQMSCFSYISPEERVPQDHPLRPIRKMVDQTLKELSPLFDELYSHTGRPSIAPEMLLRATLLQILYTIRSERLLTEQIDYNLLFRWFVELPMDQKAWNHSVFTKNRERLLNTEVADAFFASVRAQADKSGLLSDEHFTVDGTLVGAWASMKSFQPKDKDDQDSQPGSRNPDIDFRGDKRRNDTHESKTDSDARLYRKAEGQESHLCFMGHILMENRNGLAVDSRVTHATGTAERNAASDMVLDIPKTHRITIGGDKGYDTADFAASLRSMRATPHVAQKSKGSGIDERTTRHPGYAISQKLRKRVEEIFGWMKTVGGIRQVKLRGLPNVESRFTFAASVFNLIRMRNIALQSAP